MAEWELFATSNKRSIGGGNYFYSEITPIVRLNEYFGFSVHFKEINTSGGGWQNTYLMTNSTVPTENDAITNFDFFNYEYKFNLEVTRLSGGEEVHVFQGDFPFADVSDYESLGKIYENTNSGYTYSFVTSIRVKLYRKEKPDKFCKINGELKRVNSIVSKINGEIKPIKEVYKKINGEVKRLL